MIATSHVTIKDMHKIDMNVNMIFLVAKQIMNDANTKDITIPCLADS